MQNQGENFQPKSQEIHTSELLITAKFLNGVFQNGIEAWQVIKEIRKFPKPILVDFNEVLVGFDDESKLIPNPQATTFLEELNSIGNIFILTSAVSFEVVKESLEKFKLWKDNFVLMNAHTYEFIMDARKVPNYGPLTALISTMNYEQQDKYSNERNANRTKLLLEFNKIRGKELFTEEDINYQTRVALAMKRVAPIFGKKFDIPLIDDSWLIDRNNHGIKPVLVDSFKGKSSKDQSLQKAVNTVKEYYSK